MESSNKTSFYLKLAALLTVVKWKTVALTALAQYIAFLFAFNTKDELWESLGEVKVHLIILSTALFLAAGNIINNFYDSERDLVNRPYKAQFQHMVSKGFTLRLYMLLNTIGTAVAFYASWRIGIFFVAFGMALWYYSHKLSKLMLIRELAASLLAVSAFFSLLLYFKMITTGLLVYGFTLFLVLFAREVYKDIHSMKGDVIFGYRSIATSIGIIPSIRIFQTLLCMSLLSDALLIFMMHKIPLDLILGAIILVKIVAVLYLPREVVQRASLVRVLVKLLIAVYILGLAWM